MYTERLPYLLKQYLDNTITADELDELMLYLHQEDSAEAVETTLARLIEESPETADYQEADWAPLYQKIVRKRKGTIRPLRRRWMAAAAILLLLGTGFIWYKDHTAGKPALAVAAPLAHDLAPGSNKATLTLADGTTINLDAAQNGVVGQQGNAQLIKSKNEQLLYRTEGKEAVADARYNLLTTPRGGQYQLQLPDGSKVWLNAATSLRYPTAFTGSERVVELKGEAYFEITADAAKPFRVNVIRDAKAPMQVEVLGTHFNIMDYPEEPAVTTTLLEGSVRVRKEGQGVLLRPGQQARLGGNEELRVSVADTEEAVAWKDGMFRFKDAGIEQVMRQLARWYDVEVVYVNGIPRDRFQGEMYRNVNASKILKVLEASGVHFTVEGKKINLFMDKAP